MSPEEVQERLHAIIDMVDDPEMAHSAEDKLLWDALTAIAQGHPDPWALAQAVLNARKIEFPRWYA